uniref:GmrSD restriction endonucleases N-terminal domain-containing protein n=1 Tax=Moniliophthora roreri TaxID=221103 RepID=A0A0W0G065_MONRR
MNNKASNLIWDPALAFLPSFPHEFRRRAYVPISTASKSKKRQQKIKNRNASTGAAKDYKIQNALTPPRATTYTAQALFEQIRRGDIDLDPEYQRDVVWTAQKQTQLIDSIFRNYYIPPIIFCVTVHDDGSESRTCIDGKQRLTSIRLFMDGLIPHKDLHTGQQFWYKNNPEAKRRGRNTLLPEKYRLIFSNKQVVCVEYGKLKPPDERDIFRRVQLGIALTPAEKLQANATPRANFIRHLISSYCTPSTLGHQDVAWDRDRGKDLYVVGLAVLCSAKWSSHSGLQVLPRLSGLEDWMDRKTAKDQKRKSRNDIEDDSDSEGRYQLPVPFCERVEKAFQVLVKIATNKRYNTPFLSSSGISARVAPLEMVGSIMLVYMTSTTSAPTSSSSSRRSFNPNKPDHLSQLSNLIVTMRRQLREIHKDIRMNSTVARDMFDFILEASRNPFTYQGTTPGTDPEYEEEEETTRLSEVKRVKRDPPSSSHSTDGLAPPRTARKSTLRQQTPPGPDPANDKDETLWGGPVHSSELEPSVSQMGAEIMVEGQASTTTPSRPTFPQTDMTMITQAQAQAQAMYAQMMAQSMIMMGMSPVAAGTLLSSGMSGVTPQMITTAWGYSMGGDETHHEPVPEPANPNSERFSRIPTDEPPTGYAGANF